MRSTRTWWMIFAGCATVVLGSLVWVTAEIVRLEREGTLARAEADHQEAMRLALGRLDSWFAPQLAREAARPYFDYESFGRDLANEAEYAIEHDGQYIVFSGR